ncbi:lantibiotic immunity ABC transporter MutE/EpiE family permease subunit [Vagococcus sp.]|uniref:lantibiotic immunity ABC transporter MutE/EpiE family permease subunit n=1 Tax=Vagococcus sp. TaxID=1933889 RepID=UPI003F9B7E18
MLAVIKAEWLKEKNSSNRKMLLIIPIVFTLFCLLFVRMMGSHDGPVSYFVAVAYNWYPLLIGPIVSALIVSRSIIREKKGRNSDFQRSLGILPQKTWLAKIVVNGVDLGLISLFNLIILLVIETMRYGNTERIGEIILASALLLLINLALIPVLMVITFKTNQFVTIMLSFILNFSGVFPMATSVYWYVYPWSYGFRVVATLLGIHPNGTFLAANDPLQQLTVLPLVLVLSLFILVFSSWFSTRYYQKKVKKG